MSSAKAVDRAIKNNAYHIGVGDKKIQHPPHLPTRSKQNMQIGKQVQNWNCK